MTVPAVHRLGVRLAALLLVLLLAVGAAFVWLAVGAADRAAVVADQALHRDLAADLAPRFQPFLNDGIDEAAIQDMIDGLTSVNRRLDVYLLGSNGMIKSGFTDARERPLGDVVDTAPLDAFLAGAELPILAPDPARATAADPAERPFSVAPVRIMDEEGCYLYLILQNERYDAVAGALRRQATGETVVRGVAVAVGLAALVGWLLFWGLTRRLSALAETVGAFERGAHSVRTRATGRDEAGVLGRAFDRLAARIEDQIEALKRTDAQRRELVANVSHDLRSPLASLRGYLETVQMQPDAPERDDYLARALRASERMSALVKDLFDLARFDAAEIRPAPEPTALPDLAHDVVSECQARAEAAGIELRLRAAAVPLARLDAGLVERALANLLDNAIRHTPPGGTVDVEVARADGAALSVAVRDSGRGIAPEVLPRVFERFVRADAARSAQGGAGLGLAIVKRIAELHGGSVHVESVLGAGATFTLTFPVDGPPAPSETAETATAATA